MKPFPRWWYSEALGRTFSKTTAIKRTRSEARRAGLPESKYSVSASRRAGLCLLSLTRHGGPAAGFMSRPAGNDTIVLGWGRSWRQASAVAGRRLCGSNPTPPAVLMRVVP